MSLKGLKKDKMKHNSCNFFFFDLFNNNNNNNKNEKESSPNELITPSYDCIEDLIDEYNTLQDLNNKKMLKLTNLINIININKIKTKDILKLYKYINKSILSLKQCNEAFNKMNKILSNQPKLNINKTKGDITPSYTLITTSPSLNEINSFNNSENSFQSKNIPECIPKINTNLEGSKKIISKEDISPMETISELRIKQLSNPSKWESIVSKNKDINNNNNNNNDNDNNNNDDNIESDVDSESEIDSDTNTINNNNNNNNNLNHRPSLLTPDSSRYWTQNEMIFEEKQLKKQINSLKRQSL